MNLPFLRLSDYWATFPLPAVPFRESPGGMPVNLDDPQDPPDQAPSPPGPAPACEPLLRNARATRIDRAVPPALPDHLFTGPVTLYDGCPPPDSGPDLEPPSCDSHPAAECPDGLVAPYGWCVPQEPGAAGPTPYFEDGISMWCYRGLTLLSDDHSTVTLVQLDQFTSWVRKHLPNATIRLHRYGLRAVDMERGQNGLDPRLEWRDWD